MHEIIDIINSGVDKISMMKYCTVYPQKLVRLQILQYTSKYHMHIVLCMHCISYALKLYTHVCLYIKNEHEIPIYDQGTK